MMKIPIKTGHSLYSKINKGFCNIFDKKSDLKGNQFLKIGRQLLKYRKTFYNLTGSSF